MTRTTSELMPIMTSTRHQMGHSLLLLLLRNLHHCSRYHHRHIVSERTRQRETESSSSLRLHLQTSQRGVVVQDGDVQQAGRTSIHGGCILSWKDGDMKSASGVGLRVFRNERLK
jgi:hypothetical protein